MRPADVHQPLPRVRGLQLPPTVERASQIDLRAVGEGNRSSREPAPTGIPADMLPVRGLDQQLPPKPTTLLQTPRTLRTLHTRELCPTTGAKPPCTASGREHVIARPS